jgi:uncharacterized protein
MDGASLFAVPVADETNVSASGFSETELAVAQSSPAVSAYLGRLVCIQASQVVAALSVDGANSEDNLRKGALVKMRPQNRCVFGMITGLTIPSPSGDQASELYLAEIELVGELDPTETEFRRGVTAHPALGEPIFQATADDLNKVYSAEGPGYVPIGRLHQVDRQAVVAIDRMLGKHFAVLGTTGAGKSCAVSVLLHGILDQHESAHILLMDPHGEYAAAFGDRAEQINTNSLEMPFWLLNAEEMGDVLSGGDMSGDGAGDALLYLREFIQTARRTYFRTANPQSQNDAHITVDTPFPYSMRDLYRLIDEHMGKLEKTQPVGPLRWLKGRLDALRADSRFAFMFGGIAVKDNMAAILGRLFRIPTNGKPITIVDLSGIPSEILNAVVSVICRMTFDFGLWSRGSTPILLVCEEAHRYVPADAALGFEPTKQALARIAKEGRKYGVSLAIVSQRPSDIDPTILSQCNTVFAFRLTNARDQEIVGSMIKDSSFGLLDFLPTLGNGEAIVAGEAVSVPQRMRFDLPEPTRRPRSSSASFSTAWSDKNGGADTLTDVVERWRRSGR